MERTIMIAKIQRPEPRTFRVLQEGRVPDRPEWMEGEPGYLEQVFTKCPKCGSWDIWRGLWAHFPAISYILVRLEPPVAHSGRKRNCACLKCGRFWDDIQAVPYVKQEGVRDVVGGDGVDGHGLHGAPAMPVVWGWL